MSSDKVKRFIFKPLKSYIQVFRTMIFSNFGIKQFKSLYCNNFDLVIIIEGDGEADSFTS